MENINVAGITCRVPVPRRCSRDIAFRVTVCSGESSENVRFESLYRHVARQSSSRPSCSASRRASRSPSTRKARATTLRHPPQSVFQENAYSRGRARHTPRRLAYKDEQSLARVVLCAYSTHTTTLPHRDNTRTNLSSVNTRAAPQRRCAPRCGRTPNIPRCSRCPGTGSCRWTRAHPHCRAAVSGCHQAARSGLLALRLGPPCVLSIEGESSTA